MKVFVFSRHFPLPLLAFLQTMRNFLPFSSSSWVFRHGGVRSSARFAEDRFPFCCPLFPTGVSFAIAGNDEQSPLFFHRFAGINEMASVYRPYPFLATVRATPSPRINHGQVMDFRAEVGRSFFGISPSFGYAGCEIIASRNSEIRPSMARI